MFEYSFAILPIMLPFSLIVVTLRCFPFAKPIFKPIPPLSLKYFPIIPFEYPLPTPYPILIPSYIDAINISLETGYLHIADKLPLIYLFLCNIDSLAMLLFIWVNLSEIYWFLLSDYLEISTIFT